MITRGGLRQGQRERELHPVKHLLQAVVLVPNIGISLELTRGERTVRYIYRQLVPPQILRIKQMVETAVTNRAHTVAHGENLDGLMAGLVRGGGDDDDDEDHDDGDRMALVAAAGAAPVAPCSWCGRFEPRRGLAVRNCPLCQIAYHEECRQHALKQLPELSSEVSERIYLPSELLLAPSDFCCLCQRISFRHGLTEPDDEEEAEKEREEEEEEEEEEGEADEEREEQKERMRGGRQVEEEEQKRRRKRKRHAQLRREREHSPGGSVRPKRRDEDSVSSLPYSTDGSETSSA